MSNFSDGVAIVGAFMGGAAVMVFGLAAWYHIAGKIEQLRNKGQMAVRNH